MAVLAGSLTWGHAAHADDAQKKAEQRLVEILAQIERREFNDAFRSAAELTEEVPNFRAAQLVYADLLRLRTGGTPMGEQLAQAQTTPSVHNTGVADQKIAPPEFFQGLQSELQRRRLATVDLPPPGKIPSNFVHLSPKVRYVIAVDTSKSRLYVFSNGPLGVQLESNFYITIGRNGANKRLEGDQRTPLGMYFVGRQIPGQKLPDLYGKGALTVNYPNDWDRALGRTGSGIWLHGVPSDQFARVPQASDGCVVLSNADLGFLLASIDRRTPVLIAEKLEWVTPRWTAPTRKNDSLMQEITQWQTAWRQGDTQGLQAIYSAELNEPSAFAKRKNRMSAIKTWAPLKSDNLSIFDWEEEAGSIRIVNLQFEHDKGNGLMLRQYWRKQDGRWQIFSEDVLS